MAPTFFSFPVLGDELFIHFTLHLKHVFFIPKFYHLFFQSPILLLFYFNNQALLHGHSCLFPLLFYSIKYHFLPKNISNIADFVKFEIQWFIVHNFDFTLDDNVNASIDRSSFIDYSAFSNFIEIGKFQNTLND